MLFGESITIYIFLHYSFVHVSVLNKTVYQDCNNECADKCWWTTCKDSVQQTLEVLEDFLDDHCVDMNRIYALGWSNGGMFTYELANDERTAKYLAAISPQSKFYDSF